MKYCVGILLLALILAAPAGAQTTGLLFENGFEAGVNLPPVADAGLDQTAQVGQALMLDGSASWDPEGAPLGYAWRILERPDQSGALLFEADTAQPVLIADRAGLYRIELQVHDGALFSAPVTLEVQAAGALPAAAWVGPQGGAVGLDDGASVLIPPQALAQPQYIQIATTPLSSTAILPPTAVLAGAVYALQPGGLVFQRAAQITLPYRPEALPAGRSEGSIAIHRQGNWAQFDRVASQLGQDAADISSRSDGQIHHPESRAYTAWITRFSAYTALSVNHASEFAPQTLSGPNSRVVVRRPPALRTQYPAFHECEPNRRQKDIPLRTASQIQAIILHSTNNGNVGRDFNSELGWAADACNQFFAHYYIDRDGAIYQVADDLAITNHSRKNDSLNIRNTNAIGIELFLNVGEPYDGRQISALIRLTDYLMDKYALPRPQRRAETGLMLRQVADIEQGGDRVLAHADVDSGKCDPSGIFMNSGEVKPENANAERCKDPDERVTSKPLAVGDAQAPALIDIVLDVMAALDRSGQHTGLITTQGGDSYEVAAAGRGGRIRLREDAALVSQHVGDVIRTHWQQNDGPHPALEHSGPGALIVGPGVERTLTGATHEHTDAIIAGTLTLNQDTELRLTGSFYLAPNGKIVIRNGRNGGHLTVYSRGTPILQGLIDARGENGVPGTPEGGHGGDVQLIYAAPGLLLTPTLYTRGGDVDTADVSLPNGGPRGGDGGAVSIEVSGVAAHAIGSHVFMGGGVGPIIGDVRVPTWHSAPINPALLNANWAGDYLPPAPPIRLSSLGSLNPPPGMRPPLRWKVGKPGFKRGLLTSGGMGGTALSNNQINRQGGPAGHGGAITITLPDSSLLTWRDVDIATGTGIETITHRPLFPNVNGALFLCMASGAHGGFGGNLGNQGGNGGDGGNAGALSLSGGTLSPAPDAFFALSSISGFPGGHQFRLEEPYCSEGSQVIGQTIEARSSTGAALYRVRLNTSRTALLGGLGGIPLGRSASSGNPGRVGPMGATAPITGLPVQ